MRKNLKRAVAAVVAIALAVTPVVGKNSTASAASATNATVTESKDYTVDPIVLDSTGKGWADTPSDAYQLTGDFDVTFDLHNTSAEAEAYHNYLLQLFNNNNKDYGVVRADCCIFGTNFDANANPKIEPTWTCSYWGPAD